jgi:aryl-alcohol dehydrogenase-like predicted oxidoreductase
VPILGTSSLEHLNEAVGAVDIHLSESQIAWLANG